MTGKLRGGRSIFGGWAALASALGPFHGAADNVAYQTFRRAVEAGDAERAAQLAALFWNGRR